MVASVAVGSGSVIGHDHNKAAEAAIAGTGFPWEGFARLQMYMLGATVNLEVPHFQAD